MSTIIGTQTITKNPSYDTEWYPERLNQQTMETADGGDVTYDNGPNKIKGVIVLKNVTKTEGDNFRTWLTGTAIYGKSNFTITPPDNTDLGAGNGTPLTNCYYDGGPDLKGVFTFKAPALYDIKFPYRKLV